MDRPYIICHMATSIDDKPLFPDATAQTFGLSDSYTKDGVLVMNYKNNYDLEVKQRFGETDVYKEHTEKTASYTKDKWQQINEGLDAILAEFGRCKQNDSTANSPEAQALVKKLQNHITENYYTCTNEILAGLGQMYVCDERFKANIDKHGSGTAEFISLAIKFYCN